ncbi:NADP-dependent oxidoreductase [Paenibacillus sp. PR3]|uniref:NADP-dependent oxidoreductase n=2 Tax=Paenibacillus terricola TaxID=2763503 RepID=A0ABR8N1J5_9BACL|nr:NADP-dependent oxidoreductase [Paenibacillus terricola]
MELPRTMKAIRFHNHGGPEVLRLEELPVPKTSEREVLVRVHAVGVNPGDWQIRSGFAGDRFELPYIPGWDVSGVVESVGDSVINLRPGDKVFGMTANSGGCAEYVTVPFDQLALKPRSIDFIEASALPQSGVAAWHSLFEQGKLEAGQTLLINGAAGGIGHIAVQLARWKGASVIGTASPHKESFLHELGVDAFVDYTTDLPAGIGRSVDIVLDTVGGDKGDWLLDTLKPGGCLIPTAWGRYASEKATKASITVQEVQFAPVTTSNLAELAQLVNNGKIKIAIDSVFPLEETAKAHIRSESRRARGKIVIQVQ